MAKVFFHVNEVQPKLHQRNKLKQFIETSFIVQRKQLVRLDIIFCSDEFLLNINRQSLQHDYYTDIITFDLSDNLRETIAEIYISVDRVKENAKLHFTTYKEELHRVIFHGVLHLCGYSDKSMAQKQEMRKMEDLFLKKYDTFL